MPRSRNTADIYLSSAIFEAGYLNGLTLARASTTTYTVATGVARNEDTGVPTVMVLGSSFTKSLSSWAAGSGNGSLDVATILSSTWYHVHLIQNLTTGAVDVLLSLSATAPTLPSGYTARRRIGSILTNASSQITAFIQTGDTFLWDVAVQDVNATNPGATAVTRTLSVPTGAVVFPVVAWNIQNVTTNNIALLVTALSQTDSTPSSSLFSLLTAGNGAVQASGIVLGNVPTNTSGQVRTRCSASGVSDVLKGITHGWVDPRGRV